MPVQYYCIPEHFQATLKDKENDEESLMTMINDKTKLLTDLGRELGKSKVRKAQVFYQHPRPAHIPKTTTTALQGEVTSLTSEVASLTV